MNKQLYTLVVTSVIWVGVPSFEALAAPDKKGAPIKELHYIDRSDGLPGSGHHSAVAMADLDGDGRMELLSGRMYESEGLFLFTFKDGAWKSQQLTTTGEYGGVALGDITGDGIPDILAVKKVGRPAGLELFETSKKDGKLSFTPMDSPFTNSCDDLDTGDLDGDGDLDLVVSSKGDHILLNDGKGKSFQKVSLDSGVYEDTGVLLADLNSDGILDVVSANHPGENCRVFLGESRKPVSFGDRHTEGLPLEKNIGYKPEVLDFNEDGKMDLAIGSVGGLRLFKGNGCKGPDTTWWTETPLPGYTAQSIQTVSGDLNRDGHPDLVYTSNRGIHVRLHDGKGAFGPRLESPALPDKGEFSGCCVVDWDGDGDLDIAFSSFQGEGIRLIECAPK